MEEVFEIYQEFVVHSRMYVCTCVCVCAHNDRKEFNTLVVQRNLVKFPAGPKSDRQYAECKQESIPYRLRSIAKKRFNSEMEKAINFPARVFIPRDLMADIPDFSFCREAYFL